MLRRIGALAGAVVASLALPSSAQAAPTTPHLNSIPYYACGTVTASWTPSTPEYGGTIVGYRVDLGDLTTGTSNTSFTPSLSKVLARWSAATSTSSRCARCSSRTAHVTYSAPSARVFKKLCLQIPPDPPRVRRVQRDPGCIRCGLDWSILRIEDPVIQRAITQVAVADGLEQLQLEADGSVLFGSQRPLGHRKPPAPGRDELVHLLRAIAPRRVPVQRRRI